MKKLKNKRKLRKEITETKDFLRIIGDNEYDEKIAQEVDEYISWYKPFKSQEIRFLINCIKYNLIDFKDRFEVYMKQNFSERNAITYENLELRYGIEEAKKRWESYRNKQSLTNTFEYKKEKYGWNKEQFDEYNKTRAITKDNLVKKWGEEEGLKKFQDYKNKQSYVGCKLEYFIEKYGYENGLKRYEELNLKKGQTLENYQKRYGDELGLEKYKNFVNKRDSSDFCSKMSQDFFKELVSKFDDERAYSMFYKQKNYEYLFAKKGKKPIFVDFYDAITNTVIEFNGDYWHCNPKKYDPDYYNYTMSMFAKDVWKRDDERKKFLIDNFGVNLIVVWELEYNQNKKLLVENCYKKIIEYENS